VGTGCAWGDVGVVLGAGGRLGSRVAVLLGVLAWTNREREEEVFWH